MTQEKNNAIKKEYMSVFGSVGPDCVNVKLTKLLRILFITSPEELFYRLLHPRTYYLCLAIFQMFSSARTQGCLAGSGARTGQGKM